MSKYAEGTRVGVDQSRSEIERTLSRYGATAFAYGWDERASLVSFVAHGRQVRLVVPIPDPASKQITRTDSGRMRTPAAARDALDQEIRRRWRAMVLVIKAKLEAVSSGMVSFEDEFLPYTVLPGGSTVAQAIQDKVASAYATGEVPALLPVFGGELEAPRAIGAGS